MVETASGTFTFLFTDIEGSTRLWERYPEGMRAALARHDAMLREQIETHNGAVFKTVGDAFCAVFGTAPEAVAAALDAQGAFQSEPWGEVGSIRVRMALQTGAAERRDDDYFGPPLNRVARLLAAAHGGQVLLALPTAELVRDTLPDGADLRDMGDRRLKDLVRPERVFQLLHPDLPSEFPTLRTLDAHPNNLPPQATPFVGRETEVAAVRALLLRPDVRLLTLTGPGGTGKTRLSLQVAADLIDHFEDGVFFVALAPTNDPTLVAASIAQALGLSESEGRSPVEILKSYLRDKQLLLVLDNFEQVLEAASVVGDLSATCPRLKMLVTSRSVLHLYGAHNYPVPPLALPDPRHLPPIERMTQYEAVRLFVERAQAVKPDFVVTNENAPAIAEICHRLDGLPLAIELAAARVRLLPPDAILSRMERRLPLLTGGARDLPARQQTLRGAIAWGYDLLDEGERTLFRRLSVFAGGFTLDAAETISNPDFDLEVDVLDGVASLVDKSFMRQQETSGGEPRFSMLGTIREFGLEQLEASGEATEVQRRHAELYAELAAEGRQQLRGPDQNAWVERLEADYGNLKEATRALIRLGDTQLALRMGGDLWWYWYLRGSLSEGRTLLGEALASDPAAEPTPARARAMSTLGMLAMVQSDYATARTYLDESIDMLDKVGDGEGLAYAEIFRGQVAVFTGDALAARVWYRAGLATAEAIGHAWARGLALFFLANAAFASDDLAEAHALATESAAVLRQAGDPWGLAMPLSILGRLAAQRGDHETARARIDEALALRRDSQDRWGLAHLLNGAGDTARVAGDLERAQTKYEEAATLFRESGSPAFLGSVLHNLGHVAHGLGDDTSAAARFRESLAVFQELEDRRGIAECLAGFAAVAGAQGSPERAARLFGASEALLEEIGAVIWPTNRAAHDRTVAAVRTQLDEATFAAAWAAGRALSAERATAEALETRATV